MSSSPAALESRISICQHSSVRPDSPFPVIRTRHEAWLKDSTRLHMDCVPVLGASAWRSRFNFVPLANSLPKQSICSRHCFCYICRLFGASVWHHASYVRPEAHNGHRHWMLYMNVSVYASAAVLEILATTHKKLKHTTYLA
jgi:hypothetical protein